MIALIKGLSWFHAIVPAGWSAAWGRAMGWVLWAVLSSKRRLATEALGRAFPDWNRARIKETVKQMFIGNGLMIAEVLRINGNPRSNPLDEILYDPADLEKVRQLTAGKGGLVLTAHIQNYVYLAAWAARHMPLTVVVKTLRPPRINEYADRMWNRLNIQVLHHHGTYRKILKAVTSGGVVGFIMDQNAVHSKGVFVTFFDRPACTTPGLAMLSAQSGVPVIPCFLVREGGRQRIHVSDPIPAPPDRELETLQLYAQRYTTEIEKAIRRQPESWIWMHKRWKTQPQAGDRIVRPDGSAYHA